MNYELRIMNWEHLPPGGLAQLARAPALHAGGQRFESVILHPGKGGKERNKETWANKRDPYSSFYILHFQKIFDILTQDKTVDK